MAVEDAADRASFFNASEFGKAATYRPTPGTPVPVSVILDQPVEESDLGALRGVKGAARRVKLRRDEIAVVRVGDRLTVLGQTLTIRSFELDDTGEIYDLDLG